MIRWAVPPKFHGELPRDFEDDMRGFLEGESYPSCTGITVECPWEREAALKTILARKPTQFVPPIVKEREERHATVKYLN